MQPLWAVINPDCSASRLCQVSYEMLYSLWLIFFAAQETYTLAQWWMACTFCIFQVRRWLLEHTERVRMKWCVACEVLVSMLRNHLVYVSSAAERKHCVLYTRSRRFPYVGRQVPSSEADLCVVRRSGELDRGFWNLSPGIFVTCIYCLDKE